MRRAVSLTLDQILEREAEQRAMQVTIDAEEARHSIKILKSLRAYF